MKQREKEERAAPKEQLLEEAQQRKAAEKEAKKAAKEASKAQAALEKEVAQLEKEEERLCSLLPPSSMSGTVAPRLAYASLAYPSLARAVVAETCASYEAMRRAGVGNAGQVV